MPAYNDPDRDREKLDAYYKRIDPLKLRYESPMGHPEIWVYDDEEAGDVKLQFRPQGKYSQRMATFTLTPEALDTLTRELAQMNTNLQSGLPLGEGLD